MSLVQHLDWWRWWEDKQGTGMLAGMEKRARVGAEESRLSLACEVPGAGLCSCRRPSSIDP